MSAETTPEVTDLSALDYTACSFALGRGRYCQGDVRFPDTHATACPAYHGSPPP